MPIIFSLMILFCFGGLSAELDYSGSDLDEELSPNPSENDEENQRAVDPYAQSVIRGRDKTILRPKYTDSQLSTKVREALTGGPFSDWYEQVKVEVSNGRVILKGRVDNEDDRMKIDEQVRRIQGVKDVENQIKVKAQPYPY